MKKTAFLLIVFSCLFISANAQITKGQKMLGGELTFSSTTQEPAVFGGEAKNTTVAIAPEIGFGLNNNWIVGAGLGYANTTDKYSAGSDFNKTALNVFTAGVFVRKFHPFQENIGIFGQLDVAAGFGNGKETESQGGNTISSKADVNVITSSVSPGFYFKPTKRLILEANFGGLSYTNTTVEAESGSKSTIDEFKFTLTSSFGLSFRVIL